MFFFFNDTATTEIYTLSLHDALPILEKIVNHFAPLGITRFSIVHYDDVVGRENYTAVERALKKRDRKSTRLNSSHANISYAVFCLKKKKNYNCSERTGMESHEARKIC